MRRSRKKWLVLAAAGAAIAVVAVFAVKDWHLVAVHYHSSKLDEAETYEKAVQSIAALSAHLNKPGAADYLIGRLGEGRPLLTFWMFHYLDHWLNLDKEYVDRFSKRLETDERLVACYSQFVRWRMGSGIGPYLDSLSPGEEAPASTISFPCGTGLPNNIPALDMGGALVTVGDTRQGPLQAMAIAWFAGMWPLPPPGPGALEHFSKWLCELKPFRRGLSYDAGLGRCRRSTEREPLPELEPFSRRSLLIPEAPLPGWNGPVPTLPPSEPSNEVFIVPGSKVPTPDPGCIIIKDNSP